MPNNLIISYDLNRPGQSYAKVEKKIASLGPAIRLLETVWFVSSVYSASQARDHIRSGGTDANDSVVVIDAKHNDYAVFLAEAERGFLRKHWSH